MSRQRAIVLAAFIALVPCAPIAFGNTPMGIPMATLEEGQWALGLGYGYGEVDWEASGLSVRTPDGGSPAYAAEFIDLDGLRTRVVLGSLAYGVCDNWDLFARLGFCDGRDNISIHTLPPGGASERFSYDGDSGPAWGLGTRATFCYWGPWRFGGLAQITWFDPDGNSFSASDPDASDTVLVGNVDIEYWQTQVALAAMYQIDTLSFWAGPFLEFTEGDLDRNGRTLVDGADTGRFSSSADIEENTQLGVHVGVNWEASTRFNCQIEGQFTRDSWFVGLSGVMRPGQFLTRP